MQKTIAIIDDDSLITSSLSTWIEMASDYHVIAFNDPEEALASQYFRDQKVNLVISDFLMPKMNGLEFLKQAKKLCPDIICILLTGYADKQNAIRCINELNIYYYIEKPWDNTILMKVVDNGLEKQRLQRELAGKIHELEVSNNEITRLYSLLEMNYHEEQNKNEILNQWNKRLEQAVAQRTASLRNLLDNTGQGFISFGRDLLVQKEYSAECIHIFGQPVDGYSFPQLIYEDDKEQQEFITTLLQRVLDETSPSMLEVLKSLLPAELEIKGRNIRIDFRLITDTTGNSPDYEARSFVAILTDITEKRLLENQMEEEKNTLRLVVKAIVNYSELIECINDYRYFCIQKITDILDGPLPQKDKLYEIFRMVHTFKGTFGQLEAINTARLLHEFENRLSDMVKNSESFSLADIVQEIDGSKMITWLDKDFSTVRSYLGDDFFKQKDLLFVDKSKLIEIEKKIMMLFPPTEYSLILADLRQLRYKSFAELLKTYPEYLMNLSERLEKPIQPVIIKCPHIPVDTDKYSEFTKSLIHVFRNIMDHGLETPDERLESGKDEYGRITCKAERSDKTLVLTISDDGRGINLNSIRQVAVKKGLMNAEQAAAISDEDTLQLIFMEGFSTSESVTELSGRGIGLSSVKQELEKLGGKVTIHTIPNQLTEFVFRLPYEEVLIPKPSIDSVMIPLIESIQKFFEKYTGEPLRISSTQHTDKFTLRAISAFMKIKGALKGNFVLSVDQRLVQELATALSMESILPEEQIMIFEDVLAESTNMLLGSSIKLFPDFSNTLMIDPPITISAKSTTIRYPSSCICSYELDSSKGKISLCFIPSEDLSWQ